MKKRVKIVKLPTAQSGAELKLSHLRAGLGFNSNVMPWPIMAGKMSEPRLQVNTTLQPVPRHMANLEAEKDEVAMLPSKGGVPSTFNIGGQRHTNGGTPLNLPPDSFIFSDTKDMRIKDPKILAQFGMPAQKAGYTPADIAKKYNVNNFKKILADPDTDDLQRSTAETMIANYNLKLAKLALLQESAKGFPQGIPVVAMPYIEEMGMDPSQFVQANPQGDQPGPDDAQMSEYGGPVNDYFVDGGFARAQQDFAPQTRKVRISLPKAQQGAVATAPAPQGPPVSKGYDKAYSSIVNTVSDPEVTDAIYANYVNEVKNIKDPAIRAKAAAAPKEKVIANLLQMQKQNYAIHAGGVDLQNDSQVWDSSSAKDKAGKHWAKNEKYKATMAGLGFAPDAILSDEADIAIAQAAYNSTLKTSQSEKYKHKFADFEPLKGKGDEKYDPAHPNLSAPDSFYGNTTAGQLLKYKAPATPAPPVVAPVVTAGSPDVAQPQTQAYHLGDKVQAPIGSPWWLQDIIKTAHAAGNLMRIKKYMPWQATPGVYTPRVSFLDPTRELAANAEQANIQTQGMAQFTGPQAFSARSSEIQGQGFKQAANTIGQVHNQNVQISNQQDAQNAQIMNQASQQRAGLATSLWDKYQTVNQQFDNAKSQARDALVNQYVQAITNKAYTHNLNTMYPQFAINPSSGGDMYFRNPRDMKPDFNKPQEFSKVYNDLLESNPTLKANPNKAADIAMKMMGMAMPENPYLEYQKGKGNIPQYPGSNDMSQEEDQGYQ